MTWRERVMDVLSHVADPEIPVVSVVDLGIVRAVKDDPKSVVITTTYSGCPATQVITSDIRKALDEAALNDVKIEIALSPPWTTDWITEAGRDKLKAYGIAPPPRGSGAPGLKNAQPATCPRCGSIKTREVSRFGSTPCKALWQCETCREPFDRFKCH
ncbi:MAG: phenylacetate-CoA oxygenase subunit PaaJ [Proteobacteria bacterium]|nr:phenylacetate-CoA oxygenase subunit PaaJ [Pseudomonadota bacterium]